MKECWISPPRSRTDGDRGSPLRDTQIRPLGFKSRGFRDECPGLGNAPADDQASQEPGRRGLGSAARRTIGLDFTQAISTMSGSPFRCRVAALAGEAAPFADAACSRLESNCPTSPFPRSPTLRLDQDAGSMREEDRALPAGTNRAARHGTVVALSQDRPLMHEDHGACC